MPEFSIKSVSIREQFIMPAALHKLPFIKHSDIVTETAGGQAM